MQKITSLRKAHIKMQTARISNPAACHTFTYYINT